MINHLLKTFLFISLLSVSSAYAQPQFKWAGALPGFSTSVLGSQNQVTALNVNKNGQVYVLGNFVRSMDMNPGPGVDSVVASPSSIFSAYLGKYSSTGSYIWGHCMGGGGAQTFCFNDSGYMFMGGYIQGVDSFGLGYTVDTCSTAGLFIAKYDTSDHLMWRKVLPTTGGSGTILSIKADRLGNIYVTGEYMTSVDFDPSHPGTAVFPSSVKDAFVAKFDPVGNLAWARRIYSFDGDQGAALQLDAAGNILLTGYSRGIASFMDTGGVVRTVTCHGAGYDAIVAKYTNDGAVVWLKTVGGESHDYGTCIATDSKSNVYAAGRYSDTMVADVPTHTVLYVGNSNMGGYLIKYSPAGQFLWAKSYGCDTGTLHYAEVDAIACDDSDNVLLAGGFQKRMLVDPAQPPVLQLGGIKGNPGGSRDIFLLKLDSTGGYKWHLHNHSKWDNMPYALALDNARNIYMGGYITDTTDFNEGGSGGVVGFAMPNVNWTPVSFFCKYFLPLPLAVSTPAENAGLNVYPNPVKDRLIIASALNNASITVYDMQGKAFDLKINSRSNRTEVETQLLAPGTYILQWHEPGAQPLGVKFVKE